MAFHGKKNQPRDNQVFWNFEQYNTSMDTTTINPEEILTKDGLKYLIREHEVLLRELDSYSTLTTLKAKKELVDRIIRMVSQHACMEEQYLYPLIDSKLKQHKWMDRVYVDDQINKEMLQLLLEMDPESNVPIDVYDRTVHKFRMIEREHISEEENNIFPQYVFF